MDAPTIAVLLLLHGPGGGEILLNPRTVTSMRAARPGKPNEVLTDQAKCLINTTDGKFLAVIETCEAVHGMMARGGAGPKR